MENGLYFMNGMTFGAFSDCNTFGAQQCSLSWMLIFFFPVCHKNMLDSNMHVIHLFIYFHQLAISMQCTFRYYSEIAFAYFFRIFCSEIGFTCFYQTILGGFDTNLRSEWTCLLESVWVCLSLLFSICWSLYESAWVCLSLSIPTNKKCWDSTKTQHMLSKYDISSRNLQNCL